jgi:general secretion pathway protein B
VSAPPAPPPRPPEHVPARAPEPAPAAAQPAPSRPAPQARTAAPTPASTPAPAPAAAPAPAPEDSLPFLQQLPEAQQRDIPRVTFGGYMYSSNPSDRLLIVDKALRHEGEEVAPGLVLEKLLPRAAVMNFRGTRYRVAY